MAIRQQQSITEKFIKVVVDFRCKPLWQGIFLYVVCRQSNVGILIDFRKTWSVHEHLIDLHFVWALRQSILLLFVGFLEIMAYSPTSQLYVYSTSMFVQRQRYNICDCIYISLGKYSVIAHKILHMLVYIWISFGALAEYIVIVCRCSKHYGIFIKTKSFKCTFIFFLPSAAVYL